MANFVNIRLPEDKLLDPELKKIVDKLAIDNPKWVFTASKRGNSYARGVSYTTLTSQPIAPDGFTFVRVVDVSCDSELLGGVYVDSFYGRNATQSWRYNIKCWRVTKERGARDTTSTTKADVALRHIKKLFKPMDYAETMVHAVAAVEGGFNDALRALRDPIRAMRLVKSTAALQAYALSKALGEPVVSPDLIEIERTLQSDSYKQAMAEYFLSEDMMKLYGTDKLRVVVALGDNRYLHRNDAELIASDFDKLPERMQNHISVLHLMQDNEIVRDVGFRYNDTHFYVIV
jgi:hypothetical protein